MKSMVNSKIPLFKVGEKAIASTDITKLPTPVEGEVIRIWNNPFLGVEMAIKDNLGRIFFGEQLFFKPIKNA